MNITDLRTTLHERAGTVTDHNAAVRTGQVHARVRVMRRRRTAGAAALTVGALALASAVMALPSRHSDRTGPAASSVPVPVPVIQHEHFVSHSGEYDLIAAKVGEPGQSTLELSIPPHAGEIHLAMTCHGVDGPPGVHWVSGYVGDRGPNRPYGAWCGGEPTTPDVPGVHGESPGPWGYDRGLLLPPAAEQATAHVELTREVDENGAPLDDPDATGDYVPVSHPGVVLGIAAYTVAHPVTTVAGTKIRPLVGVDGQDFAYQAHRRSAPGEGQLTWTLEPATEVRYYDIVFTDASDPSNPGLVVDSSLDGGACQARYALAHHRAGGCLVSPGEPHTITVAINGPVPEHATLGIVLYGQIG